MPAAKIKSVKEDNRKVAEVAVKFAGPNTLGGKIDRMYDLREKKRLLDKQIADIEAEFDALKDGLIEQLDAQGVVGSRGARATVSISKVVVPVVKDWDKAIAYIRKNGFEHLFERRISSTAFREVLEQIGEKKILKETGMEPFTKTNVNLKTL